MALVGNALYDAIVDSVDDSDLWSRCLISLGEALTEADFLPALCNLGFPGAKSLAKLDSDAVLDDADVPSIMSKIAKRMIPVLCSSKLRLSGITPHEKDAITNLVDFQTEVQGLPRRHR